MKTPKGSFGFGAALAVVGLVFGCGSSEKGTGTVREIAIQVTDKGFEPMETKVNKGDNVVLVITRRTDQTCALDVVVEGRGAKATLPLNQPVRLALGNVESKVSFACGMDMVTGDVIAE